MVGSEAPPMAKPRPGKTKPRTKPKANTEPGDKRVAVIVLKGTPEYREWLGAISRETLIPIASIVRDAVAKWAKQRGYPEPPEV